MKDVTESKQQAQYIAHEIIKRGRSDYVQLVYKRLDGQNAGQELKTGNFVAKLDQTSRDLIKAGGEFVITKTKDGDYWNLSKVEAKGSSLSNNTQTASTSTYTKTSVNTATTGIKVGAVLHDAVSLAGVGASIEKVGKIASDLLFLSFRLEDEVNAGKFTTTQNTETKSTKTEKPTTTLSKEPVSSIDDSDFDVEF